ncbi:MAG: hypothetical protein J6C06_04620 [Lachnospiraceae bacterium]|nr:hypothetical protein [Lachnospiraceae bacterium]
MWKIYDSKKMDVLLKTQENLEETQKNNQMLATILEQFVSSKDEEETKILKSEEEKLRAAYALNLCTVSISQIIDYNDLQFMEREYDAILNNLNLEEMPKDESLLRILKQILDVIMFFRLQDGDRKLLEKEYQKKVKDAIWAAVPNPTMIVAGGTPVGMAVALATQVGIGYMNYRRERSKIDLEKERSEWELQRSALEQFHGLRRELFDTAWRLADEYNFPDEYRITERQISQYNNILLDEDDLRRYERLEYIKEYFKAYPPFWYYLGNAASSIYQDRSFSESIRREYRERAIEHFEYFFKITEHNLMREDQLVASCALEMFDLLDMVPENIEKQKSLLDKARKSSGNAFDVLQICAVSYLKIGAIDETCKLLNMLINEKYNMKMNAQLLSRLYVSNVIEGRMAYKDKYELLASRVEGKECLFPMPVVIPKTEEEKRKLTKEFIYFQKKQMQDNYAYVLKVYINKCENKYEMMCKEKADITSSMAVFIKAISDDIKILLDENAGISFLQEVKRKISAIPKFKDMLCSPEERRKVQSSKESSPEKRDMSFEGIFEVAFKNITDEIVMRIQKISDMSEVSTMDSCLYEFSLRSDIKQNKYNYTTEKKINNITSIEEIFGEDFNVRVKENEKVNKLIDRMKEEKITEKENDIVRNSKNMEFYVKGGHKFGSYLKRNSNILTKISKNYEKDVVAILNDRSPKNVDIIFTSDKVCVTGPGFLHRIIKDESDYYHIESDSRNDRLKIGDYSYANKNVDIEKLYKLMKIYGEVLEEFRDSKKSLALNIKDRIASATIITDNILSECKYLDEQDDDCGEEMADENFKASMPINNVDTATNKGIVIVGTIEYGVIGVGDAVSIYHENQRVLTTVVEEIEKSHQNVNFAYVGDDVSIVLKNVSGEDVECGDILVKE